MSQLIVALDFDTHQEALRLVDKLHPTRCALKVGSELFTRGGPQFIKQLVNMHYKVFLDLKWHDIPNTVAKACKAGADLGVWMMNVHATGGLKMMQAATQALELYGKDRPLLIAVTVLTSFDEQELLGIGVQTPILQQVKQLALLAKAAGLDGVVSSAHEVKTIKQECGTEFVTVTPGIRLSSSAKDDQSRIMTPKQAISEGSDYLVIGRPITQAENPLAVVSEVSDDILK